MSATLGSLQADIVMLGTFGVWTRGTLQSRALPLAAAVTAQASVRVAIVTTPWDDPASAGVIETRDGVPILNTTHVKPSRAPLAALEQIRLIKQLRPRLVHVMKPKGFGGLAAQILTRLPERTRLVVDSDDWEGDGGWNDSGLYGPHSRRLFDRQERELIARADAVTAASTLLAERARRLRVSASTDGVTFLPNGLASNWFDALANAGQSVEADDRSVLVYSRFAEFTPDWFRSFLNHLDETVDGPTTIHFIGEPEPAYMPTASYEHLDVRHLGYLDREELPETIARAAVAVFPYQDNLINRSKQSVKLLELLASGRAVVACDVGDIARIGGDSLALADSPAPQEVAQSVAALVGNPARRLELSEKARQRAARYSIDRLAGELLASYQRIGFRA